MSACVTDSKFVHLEHGLDQRRRRDDWIASAPAPSPTLGSPTISLTRAGHLREPVGRERLPAEDERDQAGLAGIPEELIDLMHRFCDGAPLRKRVRGLRQRQAQRRPRGQHNGNDHEDEDREIRPNRDEPTELDRVCCSWRAILYEMATRQRHQPARS